MEPEFTLAKVHANKGFQDMSELWLMGMVQILAPGKEKPINDGNFIPILELFQFC